MRNLNGRTIAIIAFLALAAIIFLPSLFGGRDADPVGPEVLPPSNNQPAAPSNPNNNAPEQTAVLGNITIARDVDADNCALDSTTRVNSSEEDFWVVAEDSFIPQGTDVFVRLYRNGQPYEDLDIITADRDYSNTCVSFVFEPDDANRFETGTYTAQFIVNGNPAQEIDFSIE